MTTMQVKRRCRSASGLYARRPAQATALRRPNQRNECLRRVCAVKRRRFPVGASPTRQPLQREATGAGMGETKCLKPSGTRHQPSKQSPAVQRVRTVFWRDCVAVSASRRNRSRSRRSAESRPSCDLGRLRFSVHATFSLRAHAAVVLLAGLHHGRVALRVNRCDAPQTHAKTSETLLIPDA